MGEQKKLTEKSLILRQEHWDRLQPLLDDLVNANPPLLSMVEPEIKITNFFADAQGIKFIIHIFVTLCIFLTGLGCYGLIARNIDLSMAVKEGVAVLSTDNVSIAGWICFIIFWVLILVYFHKEFQHDLKRTCSSFTFLCSGCPSSTDKNIETVFNAPKWKNAPSEYVVFVEGQTGNDVVEEIEVDRNESA